MFALLLWLGIAMLCAITQYAWIGTTEASALNNLFSGWNVVGTVIGGIAIGASFLFGARGVRAGTLIAGVTAIVTLRDMLSFNYPSIFYGPYEIVRWILLIIMLAIFIMPLLWSVITGGVSSSS